MQNSKIDYYFITLFLNGNSLDMHQR